MKIGKLIILLLVIIFSLSSCIGIKMVTEVKNDDSGTTEMEIRIAQMFFQMDQEEGEETEIPVPISKEELESDFEGVDGVEVVRVDEEDTEEYKIITSEIHFDHISLLAGNEMFSGAKLSKTGGQTEFSVILKEPELVDEEEEEMDESTIEMVASFYEGYFFEYTFIAPSKIKEHSLGELSGNGRELTYKIPMYDFSFMELEEPLVLTVVW